MLCEWFYEKYGEVKNTIANQMGAFFVGLPNHLLCMLLSSLSCTFLSIRSASKNKNESLELAFNNF